ncbi:MAG: hypothetical protein KKD73_13095, partial [Proteobacteria bacterium]|nr:hypothetical protein [Pseudomonadota bacterium]
MPFRFFAQLSLKNLIVLSLLAVGLLPLGAIIGVNLPMVAGKLEQLTELERLSEIEDQVDFLEKTIEHRKENLRTITALPGATDLFSDSNASLLDPKKIKQRMGGMFSRWLPPDSAVQTIVMVNAAGEVVNNWSVNGNE